MMRITAALRVLTMLSFGLLAACAPRPDAEQALKDWVDRGEAAVGREDRRELMSMVSPTYADGRGNSREDLERMLRLVFLRQDNVTVVTRIEELDIHDGTAADIVLTTAVAGWNESLFGFDADALRMHFELEHDGEDWRLMAARWGRLGEDLR